MEFITFTEAQIDPAGEELDDPIAFLLFLESLPEDEAIQLLSDYFNKKDIPCLP